jgi:hypothetical protein
MPAEFKRGFHDQIAIRPLRRVDVGKPVVRSFVWLPRQGRRSAEGGKILLIVVFDEHGGYYDHVAPPATVSPDGIAGRTD